MNKNVKRTVKQINVILKERCPTYTLDISTLQDLECIRSDTTLTFYEKICTLGEPRVVTRKWKHFKYRGLPSSTNTQLLTLYFVIFRNKKTGELHYKLGTTKSVFVEERFQKKSATWEYVCAAVAPRTGPKDQIREIEKRMKEFCVKNKLIQPNVEDFIFSGKTELLIPTHNIPIGKLIQLFQIFNDKGFDDL